MKPHFLGIGEQKCAFAWPSRILEAHPETGVGDERDVRFCSFNVDRGYQWYGRNTVAVKKQYWSEQYLGPVILIQQFRGVSKGICWIQNIIVSLRDPVQRALSNPRNELRVEAILGAWIRFGDSTGNQFHA